MKSIVSILLCTFIVLLICSSCNLTDSYIKIQNNKLQKSGFKNEILQQEDFKLSYTISGEGEALLLIHGFGGDGEFTWTRQMHYFSKSYRVIVPDLLWFGDSYSSKTPSLHAQADVLLQLLDTLGIEKVHLAGLSYGGFVCMEMYRTATGRIKSVVIVDSPGPNFDLSYLDHFLKAYDVEKASDIFVPENAEELQRLFDIVMYRDIKFPASLLEDLFNRYWIQHQNEQRILLAELPENKQNFEDFNQYNKNDFLVIWGKEDEVFPYQSGIDLAAYLNCQIIAFNRSGHTVSVDKARRFNRALSRFLKRE